MNVAAGIDFSTKVGNSPVLSLTNDKGDLITLSATKYNQGRTHPPIFGAPYKLCLGFPLNNTKSATREKVDQQRVFLELYWNDDISHASLFGSSQFLITILHGGRTVESIAHTEAHRLLLLKGNSKSKVFIVLTINKSFSYFLFKALQSQFNSAESFHLHFYFFIFIFYFFISILIFYFHI